MPRLTQPQATALGNWWDIISSAAYGGLLATDVIAAAADIARQEGGSLSFTESQAIAVLYGYAKRMSNAADALQSASDDDPVGADVIGIPPWARDEQESNAIPIWHTTFEYTYIDADGVQQTDYRTSIFKVTFPGTVGELKDAVDEDAQAMADKYGHEFVSANVTQILAV